MSVTKKQVADQLALISKSEEKEDFHSVGWTAVQRIVHAMLRGSPDYISSRPKERQLSIAEWCARHNVVFKDLPASADDTTIRITVDPHYNPIIKKMSLKGDNLIVSIEYSMTVSVFKTRVKTVWKDIDEDTRKRVPVLDENEQPIFETLPPQSKESKIVGKMTLPVDLFVDLLNEIGRDSLMEPPPENYVPPVIGEALMNVLGAAGIHPGQERMMRAMMQMARMPRMVAVCDADERAGRNGVRGYAMDMRDMMMDMGGYEMLGYGRGNPVPCRVFLQPDDKGRTEIIAEPYSPDEIKQNQILRRNREKWMKWIVQDTEAVLKRKPWQEAPKQQYSMSID